MKSSRIQMLFASGITFFVSSLFCQLTLAWVKLPGATPWSPPAVTYYFSSSLPLPNNDFKNRIREGVQAWNSVANSNFRFSETNTPDGTVTNQGVVTYEPLGRGLLGLTSYIVFVEPPNPNPSRFKSAFNSTRNWYFLTGKPSKSQSDFKSVATHEFGHALLLDHTNITTCPIQAGSQDLPKYPTMCPRLFPGDTYWRTLEPDDKAGVSTLY